MIEQDLNQLRAEIAEQQARITHLEQELAAARNPARDPARGAPPYPDFSCMNHDGAFRAIFENAGVGIAILNLAGRNMATNRTLQEMLGYTNEQLLGLHFSSITHPDDGDADRDLLLRLLAGEISRYQIEKRYLRRDGSTLLGKLTISLARNGGTPLYVICLVEDITQQKKVLAALDESQAIFRHLANHLDVVFWMYDALQQRTIYESPAFESVWGRSIESALADPQCFYDSVLPEDRQSCMQGVQQILAGRQITNEYRIMRPDGSVRTILDKGFPIHDKHGAVVKIAGLATDVTEARLATEHIRRLNESLEERVRERTQALSDALVELREQSAFLRQVMETMREGVVVFNKDNIVEYANSYIAELMGAPLDQIVGHHDRLAILAADPAVFAAHKEERRADQPGDYELTVRLHRGEERHWRIMSTPRIHRGQYNGGIAVISDLTQHRQAEENLRRTSESLAAANDELARAARMKDKFLANVSHELRTPLTGILALSEALAQGAYGEMTEPQSRRVQLIEECGRHLLSLINDILDVAKSQAGHLELHPEPVPVQTVCLAALNLVRDLAAGKQQQISYTQEPVDLRLVADSRRLKQILVNLLGNAVKFTPVGGSLGLAVQGDLAAATVKFSVWDQGIGIPADRLQQIFDPFVQVDSDLSRSYSGSGLGLALVHNLAALHGGSVSVESQPGHGSSFHVTLPWRPA